MERVMKTPKLVDLISNDDGSLSRTQAQIVGWTIYTMLLIVAHIILDITLEYKVLTPPVLLTLFVAYAFSFAERMDIRHFHLKVGKDGVQASTGGKEKCLKSL